jgi:hypothetical protein
MVAVSFNLSGSNSLQLAAERFHRPYEKIDIQSLFLTSQLMYTRLKLRQEASVVNICNKIQSDPLIFILIGSISHITVPNSLWHLSSSDICHKNLA